MRRNALTVMLLLIAPICWGGVRKNKIPEGLLEPTGTNIVTESTVSNPAHTNLVYKGYIQVERDHLYDVRAKEFNGNYFIAEKPSGGKRIPVYANWFDRLSKLVGKEVIARGRMRHMKSGDELQIESLDVVGK